MMQIEGPVHLVGVGGMHMSAIAQILLARGVAVTGSDLRRSALTARVEALGGRVFEGHAAENVGDVRLVVTTAAAARENPELTEARRRALPVLQRAEMVARLMEGKRVIAVAGSHGKTTTSSLIAYILQRAGQHPMYLLGGESIDLGGNAGWGAGPACVVEADEYKRAFHEYRPAVAVITNIEADHLDYFGTAEEYYEAFVEFARLVQAGGRLVVGVDDAGSRKLAEGDGRAATLETFATNRGADWRAIDVKFDEEGVGFRVERRGKGLGSLRAGVPGRHFAANVLAAALGRFGEVKPGERLSRHTTFGIGGPADLLVTVRDAAGLAGAAVAAREAGQECFVLGSGSNLLVADAGMRGVVVDNRARGEETDNSGRRFRVESGASFASLARRMGRQGLDGLTWAVGIPGTLGGAVVYNAGAYGGCLGDVLRRVRLQGAEDSPYWAEAGDLGLVYRGSMFTRGQFAGRTVLEMEIELTPGEPKELAERAAGFDARRLGAQPRGRNAGSMFKNPPQHPAWKLIDSVGLRGERRGDAAISEKHCNFFVNQGNARAADVAWLVEEAERRVREQFGIGLEREVAFVGEW